MGRRNQFKLDTVSIQLVKDSPVYSDFQIKSPFDAVHLVGETICGMVAALQQGNLWTDTHQNHTAMQLKKVMLE